MHWWVFFAVNPLQKMSNTQVREAKSFCHACPVMLECLNYALVRHERFGVWGGMTGEERKRALDYYDDEVFDILRDMRDDTLKKGVVLHAPAQAQG